MKEKRKLKEWIYQKSILKKLVISYIILFILLIASNLFIYIRTENILMSKEITYNRMALDYAQDIMDQNIQNIYKSCTDLMVSREMQNRLSDLDSVANRVYAINKLLEFTQKNDFIEHAIIWTPASNSMLYEAGTLSAEDAFSIYLQNGNLNKETILEHFKQADIGYIPKGDIKIDNTPSTEGSGYIVICYSSAYAAKGSKLLLLLPEDRIRELFKNVYGDSQFMIITEDGKFVVRPGKDFEKTDLLNHLMASVGEKSDSHFLYQDYLVIHCKSEIFHWEYTAIISCAEIFHEVTIMRKTIFTLLFAVLLLSGLVIIFSIRQTYMPLKDILNYIRKGKQKTAENEYAEIKHELLNLNKNNHLYKENLTLYELIQHGNNGRDLHEFFSESYICSIMLAGPEIQSAGEIVNALEKAFTEKQCGIHLVKSNSHEMYLILNKEFLSKEEVVRVLEEIWKEKQPKLFAGVGSVETVQNLKQSCDEAKLVIKNGKISACGCVYVNEDSHTDCIQFPLDFEIRMTSYIYASDKASVQAFIEEIFENNQGIDWSAFSKLSLDFCENYKRIASKLQLPICEDISENITYLGYDLEQIKSFLEKLYSEIVFEEPIDKRACHVGAFVKDYINKNYRNSEITIEGIAEELDLAPTYVSTLFKKEAQISFSQYLSDFRIQKATDLLSNTDMKIKDVALEVGFGTYSNFARTFKKKLGTTPVEYKSQKLSTAEFQ